MAEAARTSFAHLHPAELSRQVGEALKERGETLAVAESCTGGEVCEIITMAPGSSHYFVGGLIAYSPPVKIKLLNVPSEVISSKGIVSKEVAIGMAKGVRKLFGTTWGIATTGVAGPGPDESGNPEGLVVCAVDSSRYEGCGDFLIEIPAERRRFSRAYVKRSAALAAVQLLAIALENAA